MSSLAGELSNQKLASFWLLIMAAIVPALAMGYTISLDPKWLRIGFNVTRIEHLFVVLVGAVIAITILRWPEVGLFGLIAAVATNASEVGVRFHGLPSALQVFVPVLIVALAGRQLGSRRPRFVSDRFMVWLIVMYGAIMFATSARALNPELADERVFEYLKSLLIVLVIMNLLTSRLTLWRAGWVLVLVGAFLGTISVYQVLTSSYGVEFGGFGRVKLAHIVGRVHEPRIAGPLGDPNFYAQALVMLVPIALYRLWNESSIRLKATAAYALAVIILALVFTFSRGGVLALGLVLVLAVIQQKKLQHLLLGLLVLAPLIFFIPEQFEGRMSTLNQLIPGRNEATLNSDSSFQQRTLFLRSAWGMFVDHPFLGVGVGNYSEHYEEYAALAGSTVSSYEDFGKPRLPHSLYLQVAAETGVVGLVVFMAIIIATLLRFRSAHQLFVAAGDLRSASIVVSLALGFIGYLTTSVFLHGDYMRPFWLLVALAMAAGHIAQHDHSVAAERGALEI